MFLVLLRHTIDDVPLSLHATHEEALAAALAADPMPPFGLLEKLGWNECSTPVCISIVEFAGGTPIRSTIVRHFDSQTALELISPR